ncbi:MAG: hypothetical protein ACRDKE_11295 [Solirubrobacterales bacterium]
MPTSLDDSQDDSQDDAQETRGTKRGPKPKTELQRAIDEAAADVTKIDTAINLADLTFKEAQAEYKREMSRLSGQRTVATTKLRDAVEKLTKRVIPGMS